MTSVNSCNSFDKREINSNYHCKGKFHLMLVNTYACTNQQLSFLNGGKIYDCMANVSFLRGHQACGENRWNPWARVSAW